VEGSVGGTNVNEVNCCDHFFPVMGGELDSEGRAIIQDIYGTAVSIGGGFFLTAAHVLRSARTRPASMLLYKVNGRPDWRGEAIEDGECHDYDIGIFRVSLGSSARVKTWPWNLGRLPMLRGLT
jgi:hypothetical protein